MVFIVPTLFECAAGVVVRSVPSVYCLKSLFNEKPRILPTTIKNDLLENYQYFYATSMKRVYITEQELGTEAGITFTPEEIINLFHPDNSADVILPKTLVNIQQQIRSMLGIQQPIRNQFYIVVTQEYSSLDYHRKFCEDCFKHVRKQYPKKKWYFKETIQICYATRILIRILYPNFHKTFLCKLCLTKKTSRIMPPTDFLNFIGKLDDVHFQITCFEWWAIFRRILPEIQSNRDADVSIVTCTSASLLD